MTQKPITLSKLTVMLTLKEVVVMILNSRRNKKVERRLSHFKGTPTPPHESTEDVRHDAETVDALGVYCSSA